MDDLLGLQYFFRQSRAEVLVPLSDPEREAIARSLLLIANPLILFDVSKLDGSEPSVALKLLRGTVLQLPEVELPAFVAFSESLDRENRAAITKAIHVAAAWVDRFVWSNLIAQQPLKPSELVDYNYLATEYKAIADSLDRAVRELYIPVADEVTAIERAITLVTETLATQEVVCTEAESAGYLAILRGTLRVDGLDGDDSTAIRQRAEQLNDDERKAFRDALVNLFDYARSLAHRYSTLHAAYKSPAE